MFGGEDFLNVTGVTLAREIQGEKNLRVKLFLKNIGLVSLTSKNFGGDSEPLVWGHYELQKHSKIGSYFVYDIEVTDDMLHLRYRKDSLITAVEWTKLLLKFLPYEHPDDELLANLYWNMKLLCVSNIPADSVHWRFMWKWIECWGLAPDLMPLLAEKNFNSEEISLLAQINLLDAKGVTELFAHALNQNIRKNIFKIAAKIAMTFLNEK